MKNIFENAYFGKPYKTRDGRKAIYLYGDRCWIDGNSDWNQYYSNGYWFMSGAPNKNDIVSEWQEGINEKELDKLAKEYMTEEKRCIIKGGCDLSFYDLETAFKAGFHARGAYCKTINLK